MSAHVVVGTDTPADRIIADMHVLPHCRFGVDYITRIVRETLRTSSVAE